MSVDFDIQKTMAEQWFHTIRNHIVARFELLEDEHPGPAPAGRFDVRETRRSAPDGKDAGGGLMSVMRGGRVFEKVGVNVSAVHGSLGEAARKSLTARKEIPGLDDDPRFWASGISLVAHMANPMAPAVHMNTRMFWTPGAWWFGGGTDLNPAIEFGDDTAHFHSVLKAACDAHDREYYARFKDWADTYFYIPHRKRARGVGGIFYDDLCTGDWQADFYFTQSIGRAFIDAFEPLARDRSQLPFTDADREQQLVHRGLYAEFNLVYDRGTKFGLETGHDPDAVLMSLPPLARWP